MRSFRNFGAVVGLLLAIFATAKARAQAPGPDWNCNWTTTCVNLGIQGIPYSATAPTSGQVYQYNSTTARMEPTAIPGSVVGAVTPGDCSMYANTAGQTQDAGAPCGNNPAGVISGAIASDGAGHYRKAATTDLSDVTPCSWSPTDQSGALLTFTAISVGCTKQGNIYFVYGAFTFPTPVGSTANVLIGGLPATVPNQPYAQTQFFMTANTGAATGVAVQGTNTFQILSPAGARYQNRNLAGNIIVVNFWFPAT